VPWQGAAVAANRGLPLGVWQRRGTLPDGALPGWPEGIVGLFKIKE